MSFSLGIVGSTTEGTEYRDTQVHKGSYDLHNVAEFVLEVWLEHLRVQEAMHNCERAQLQQINVPFFKTPFVSVACLASNPHL